MEHIEVIVDIDDQNYLHFLEFAGRCFTEDQLKLMRQMFIDYDVISVTLKGVRQ